MPYTLGNLITDLYDDLSQLTKELASGGSSSSAVCSKLIGLGSDGDYDGGILIVAKTTDGLAPQGEISRISAYVDSTGTFTLETTLTATIGSGDTIQFSNSQYPPLTMIDIINRGLRSLGEIALVNDSITTAAGQSEYTYPVALKGDRPLMVEIQTNADTDDNEWEEITNYSIKPAAANSTGLIIFKEPLDNGKTIRIWYRGSHPTLSAYTDYIQETITPILAVAAAKEKAAEWLVQQTNGADQFASQQFNVASQNLLNKMTLNPMWSPRRKNKRLSWRGRSGG